MGITGNYNNGVLTISGIALQTGTFNYTVNTTGTCVQKSETGQINISPVTVAGNLASRLYAMAVVEVLPLPELRVLFKDGNPQPMMA